MCSLLLCHVLEPLLRRVTSLDKQDPCTTCREITEAIPVPLTSLQPLVRAARVAPGIQYADSERVMAPRNF